VADVAARAKQEVVQLVPQRDGAQVGAVLGDPPVAGMDTALTRRPGGIRLAGQPADPPGESGGAVHVIAGSQAGAVLVDIRAHSSREASQESRSRTVGEINSGTDRTVPASVICAAMQAARADGRPRPCPHYRQLTR
jgi:hypothetical protein